MNSPRAGKLETITLLLLPLLFRRCPLRPTQSKTRIHNRVRALMHEEHCLTQRWAEHDLKSARETAWEILPLLRLEASQSKDGGQSASLLRIMDTKANSHDENGSYFLRRFHVLDHPVELEQVATTTTRSAARKSSHSFGLRRSFGLQQGSRGCSALPPAAARGGTGDSAKCQAVEGQGTATRMVTSHGVAPAPLRARGCGGGLSLCTGSLVPFERRNRGEGFLEGHRPGLGSNSRGAATIKPDKKQQQSREDNRPTPLAQQVLRLEDGGTTGDGASSSSESVVAVVRAVLEPPSRKKCDWDCALLPDKRNQEDGGDLGLRRDLGLCKVREVIRVEAYLPSSSTTLMLRVKVPSVATASTRGVEGSAAAETHRMGNADNDSVHPLRVTVSTATKGTDSAAAPARTDIGGTADAGDDRRCEKKFQAPADTGHEEECRSRKQQRRIFWEARATEARRGAAETLAAVQEASADLSQGSLLARKHFSGTTQQQQSLGSDKRAHDSQPKPNNAFSMLLIRANAILPIERLSVTSGSWREAIGELVGCPLGVELRAVRGTRAVASRKKNSVYGERRFSLDEKGGVAVAFSRSRDVV